MSTGARELTGLRRAITRIYQMYWGSGLVDDVPAMAWLYLVPVKGSDSDWYKNILKTPTIRLVARAAQLEATATPTSDTAKIEQVLDGFRAKYGARDVEAYYPKQDVAVQVPLT